MKTIAFVATALALASLVGAASAQDAKQKTGYQVKGCTEYKLASGAVVQICDPTKPDLIHFEPASVNKQARG